MTLIIYPAVPDVQVIKLLEAKKGFVLLPCRWGVERSFGWTARFRRLARDYERLPETQVGRIYLAFAMLMLKNFVHLMAHVLYVHNTLKVIQRATGFAAM